MFWPNKKNKKKTTKSWDWDLFSFPLSASWQQQGKLFGDYGGLEKHWVNQFLNGNWTEQIQIEYGESVSGDRADG